MKSRLSSEVLRTGPQLKPYTVDSQPVSFTQTYLGGGNIHRQFEKGALLQWRVSDTTLFDWDTYPDFSSPIVPDELNLFFGTRYWIEAQQTDGGIEKLRQSVLAEQLCQFLHGEQGALKVTGQLVGAVEECNTQLAAGMQVGDEARHVEFFRTVVDRFGASYPVNPALQQLIDTAMHETQPHYMFISMQLLIEGLALAAFKGMQKALLASSQNGGGYNNLQTGLHYVILDESRHVGLGILALREMLKELSSRERRECAEFVFEGFGLMRERLLPRFVCEDYGWDPTEVIAESSRVGNLSLSGFQNSLITGILPQAVALGVVPDDLREKYTDAYGVDWSRVHAKSRELEGSI